MSSGSRGAALYAGAAILLWPPIELIGARLGARHNAFQTVWLRYGVHITLLLVFCALRGRLHALRAQRPLLQLLRGAMMFVMPLGFVTAAGAAGVSAAWTVFWIAPLLVLMAAPLIGETPSRLHWLAAALGWIGAVLVFNVIPANITAIVAAVLMASSFAAYLLLSRVLRIEPLPASLLFTGIGAIVPMTLFALPGWTPLTSADILPVLAIGTASLLFLAALDRAVEIAPTIAIAPLFTGVVIVEAVQRRLSGDPTGMIELGGLTMILAGLALLRPLRTGRAPAMLTQDNA